MKKQVFELNDDGSIKEIWLMSDEEIEKSDKTLVIEGWQERLFEPRWDFEQEKWVEGLSDEEVEQTLKEIELQQNKPNEQERIEALENALIELILRSDNDD